MTDVLRGKNGVPLAEYMCQVVVQMIVAGFTYKEGWAIFQALADTLKRVDETEGMLPDIVDAAILDRQLRDYLK